MSKECENMYSVMCIFFCVAKCHINRLIGIVSHKLSRWLVVASPIHTLVRSHRPFHIAFPLCLKNEVEVKIGVQLLIDPKSQPTRSESTCATIAFTGQADGALLCFRLARSSCLGNWALFWLTARFTCLTMDERSCVRPSDGTVEPTATFMH